MKFKRVPAIDKCFQILELFGRKKEPMNITEISNELNLNKSTVYNMVYTLSDLGILENHDGRFRFGTRLYVLGKAAEQGSDLIRNIHPYLVEITRKTNLSAFLGMRSGLKVVIIDKSDSSYNLKISSDIGTSIPLVTGAHGKALLSQLKDDEIEAILSETNVKTYILPTALDKKNYWAGITRVRDEGVAYEDEEYIEGIRALAIPLKIRRGGFQCAIWAVGLKSQIKETSLQEYTDLLKTIANRIESKISL